ncbi:MAG: transcriptional repressor [Actinomycetota bacterium]|nr:transcriptional repressor [Actinomycetota bacterium]
MTPQRVHVWSVLAESGGHFTAEEIWDRAKDGLPGLELSTVYRSLEALGGAGLVADSRLPEGPRVFEARSSSHPHLVCGVCGGISHPEADGIGRSLLEALNAASEGFEVSELNVAGRGICAACAAERQ